LLFVRPFEGTHTMTHVRTVITLLVLAAGCAAPRPAPQAAVRAAVPLSLRAPAAVSVAVAGTFNRWDPGSHRLAGPGPDGRWTITLSLPPGRYEYLFLVNGSAWVPDPAAPSADDGLGGRNSVLTVPADAGQ
jgi:1,4-alpha-glucan branching enzyme